jgi:Protein of unknown function (DUF3073)
MGRGRQKAKHTKVARELKYFSPNTDYNALERELGTVVPGAEPDYEDKWADLYEDEDGDSDGDDGDSGDGDSAAASAADVSADSSAADGGASAH